MTDPMPAIVRDVQDADTDADVLSTPYNSVSFRRGLGDTGYKLEIVEYDCPACGHDRMVRKWSVNPETADMVKYFCQSPSCPHHVEGKYGYAKGRRASKPVIPLNEPETWGDA